MRITSEIEFSRAVKAIENELVYVSVNYGTLLELQDLFERYSDEANRTKKFWAMTQDNYKSQIVLSLCRIYDLTKGVCSLPTFLQAIKSLASAKDAGDSIIPGSIDKRQLAQDIEMVSRRDSAVMRLGIWRDKVMAHTDGVNTTKAKSVDKKDTPTFGDIPILIRRAMDIVGRYSPGAMSLELNAEFAPKGELGYIFDALQYFLSGERALIKAAIGVGSETSKTSR